MRHPLLATGAVMLMLALSPAAPQAQPVLGGAEATGSDGLGAPAPAGVPRPFGGERWERTYRASKIIGTEVRNPEGERLGSIEDLVLDSDGRAAYAIVSSGGFLGLGDRLHAVPWSLLQTHNEGYHLLDIERERLREAPSFDARAWPDFQDERWARDNRRYFGLAR